MPSIKTALSQMFSACVRVGCLALLALAASEASAAVSVTPGSVSLSYASTKDIRDINPHLYGGEMAAQNMVFEPLVVNGEQGVRPWLAQSWEISPDGKQYTFHLRQG